MTVGKIDLNSDPWFIIQDILLLRCVFGLLIGFFKYWPGEFKWTIFPTLLRPSWKSIISLWFLKKCLLLIDMWYYIQSWFQENIYNLVLALWVTKKILTKLKDTLSIKKRALFHISSQSTQYLFFVLKYKYTSIYF
jgi:hypothetical protein